MIYRNKGFTIVELLIVVVVIAILAAITIVAYNGISNRARVSSVQSDLVNAGKALESRKLQNATEQYPSTLAAANINVADANYIYESSDNSFCLTKTAGSTSYYVSSFQKNPAEGSCGSDSMIGWWQFNGNANDSVGSNNGTVLNASLASGQNGQANGAYSFNGTNATINFGNSTTLRQPNVTMSVWARPTSPNSVQMLLGKEAQYKYRFNTSGSLGALISTTGVGWMTPQPNTSAVVGVANTWVHTAMTFNSTDRTLKMYSNGSLLGTWTLPAEIVSYNNNSFFAGSTNGNTEFFNGLLDDARFYGRVLGAAEIKGLYDAGAK